MIREERLLKVLRAPHVSEKASTAMEKSNTIVLKVAKDATKAEIKLLCRNCLKSKSKSLTPW
ncbi:50S ribosomal protein L23 [Escherichia coli]|nr:50S ribosomal protein L23 [Escherichia coli]